MRCLPACIVAVALAVPCAAEVEVLVGSPAGRVAKDPDVTRVNEPFTVAFDDMGRMYGIEYTRGNRLFRVGVRGDAAVEFVAGKFHLPGRGEAFPPDAATAAADVRFHGLHDVAVGPDGVVYLADTFNHRIRNFDPQTGTVSVVAGTGTPGFGGDDGPAATAVFNQAYCRSLTPDGRSLLVADLVNVRLRRIDRTSGIVTTVAGNGTKAKPLDGAAPLETPLAGPKYVSLDRRGRVLIADTENHCIRRYDPASGTIRTVAGIPMKAGAVVGADLLSTQLARPHGCCPDPAGRLVIADSDNDRILAGEIRE